MLEDKKLIIANWKMKLGLADTIKLAEKVKARFSDFTGGIVGVCPNFISLKEVGKILSDSVVALGAQDVFWENEGAYTGEVSPKMLVDAGCRFVIIGHSERRKYLGLNYEMVNKSVKAVLETEKLIPIVCIGENWDERKTDRRDFVLFDQLQQALKGITISGERTIIIAYEPIWAIGSGTAIEPTEAEYAHKVIKLTLGDMYGIKAVNNNFRIIYGGSINSKNVKGFIGSENIDGLLVGTASLDEEEFYKVAKAVVK